MVPEQSLAQYGNVLQDGYAELWRQQALARVGQAQVSRDAHPEQRQRQAGGDLVSAQPNGEPGEEARHEHTDKRASDESQGKLPLPTRGGKGGMAPTSIMPSEPRLVTPLPSFTSSPRPGSQGGLPGKKGEADKGAS